MTIWRWADWIDHVPPESRISLGEGDTPLIRSKRIGPQAGLQNLFFKLETMNPAGSFKDRFGAAAISHMLASQQTECIATSSGNTGAALAAYCAATGLRCQIAVVETVPDGKLRQMMAYGADVFRIRRFGIDADLSHRAFLTLNTIASRPDAALQVSSYIYSPQGMSGVETISLELSEQLQGSIDHVFCPAGGGGLCVAVARGFARLVERGMLAKSPAIDCVQPAGNNTIAGPLRDGAPKAHPVESTTKISGLQVANINDGHLVISECRPTGGTGHLVSDAEVWHAQKRLAQEEGIFSEPAGAVALAGALQAVKQQLIRPDGQTVCLVTGIGFKDEESVKLMLSDNGCPTVDLSSLELRCSRA